MGVLDWLKGGSEQDRFAHAILARLRRGGLSQPMRYESADFLIAVEGERVGKIYLINAFQAWQAAAKVGRDKVMADFVASILEIDAGDGEVSFDEARSRVLPIIRTRSHLVAGSREARLEGREAPFAMVRPLGEHLAVTLAVDLPQSLVFVTDAMLAEWGVTEAEAMDLAMENLRAVSPRRFVREDEGFYVSDYGDYSDASRMLLPELFEGLNLDGAPVAVVVLRSGVVVAGANDTAALNAMSAFAEAAFRQDSRPISLQPLILADGEWRAFRPTAPELAAVAKMSVLHLLWEHTNQKADLDAENQALGRDVYVAHLDAVTADDGAVLTWSTWSLGVETLLARADVVVVNRGADLPPVVRAWKDLEAACGPFAVEPDTYPPRYLVTEMEAAALERLMAAEHPAGFPAL